MEFRCFRTFLLFFASAMFVACSDSFTDPRDEQSYDIVQIGSDVWMAENLNYDIDGSVCPEGDKRNCSKFGRLYTWEMARSFCPEGWRLPNSADFGRLIANVGGVDVAGEALKSKRGWYKKKNGSDAFGFKALPAGFRKAGGEFDGIGGYAHFWTASSAPLERAEFLMLEFSRNAAVMDAAGRGELRSVRCIREQSNIKVKSI